MQKRVLILPAARASFLLIVRRLGGFLRSRRFRRSDSNASAQRIL